MTRPSLDEYYCAMARLVATRSTCVRCKVGAVVARDGHLMGSGYNGPAQGEPHCDEGGCPRGSLSYGECAMDSDYSNCTAVHAEANALIRAGFDRTNGGTLYVTRQPCPQCGPLVKAAGIERVVVCSE